jgi:hypothetical protein
MPASRGESGKKIPRLVTNRDASLTGELVERGPFQGGKQIDLLHNVGHGAKILLNRVHPVDFS